MRRVRRGLRGLRALLGNWVRLVLGRGLRGWARNLLSTTPALGSMVVLLTIAGTTGIAAIATVTAVRVQADQAYVLHVYLADTAAPDSESALQDRLRSDPRVRRVVLVDSAEALRRELRRPGVAGLVDAAGSNPFPASLEVTLRSAEDIAPVAAAVAHDPAVDPTYPTSYDPSVYARLHAILLVGAAAGGGILLVLAFVAVAVTANVIRATVVGRRQEIRVMRLVGAPWWAVRLPFLVEGGLTGALAGILAAAGVAAAAELAAHASAALFVAFLPGVTMLRLGLLAAALVAVGALLGSAAGTVALRRLP